MNKDKVVAFFEKKNGLFEGDTYFEILENVKFAELPIGFSDITTWIEGRKASKHNAHLKEIMERLGCTDSEGFIRTTHATSINDTFWVKRFDEPVSWKDVSLYENEFTETISNPMLNAGSTALPYQEYEGKIVHEKDLNSLIARIVALENR